MRTPRVFGDAEGISLALFGAALDSGNLGVAALGSAFVEGATGRLPDARVTVFDNGVGQRPGQVAAGDRSVRYQRSGARYSRRFYMPESMQTMYHLARFGGLNNPGVDILKNAAATFDVSGGDSFTDMYSERTFRLIMWPKRLALRVQSPLVLLPQTYGPFYAPESRAAATDVLRQAHCAWTRDANGYDVLKELLGADFDEQRHREGVDMAFGLTPTEPNDPLQDNLRSWLELDGPLVGVNVSGLLIGDKPTNKTFDALSVDYEQVMLDLLRRFLAQSDARLLLVPHVDGSGIAEESDLAAIKRLVTSLGPAGQRIRWVETEGLTANTAKWWISRCDWFCGTRMHATIAALSSGVPTSAIAYSLKTEPVFATVGQEAHVVDARTATAGEIVERVWASWLDRAQTKANLAPVLPELKLRVDRQMDAIVGVSRELVS